jgi:hypothetical protein
VGAWRYGFKQLQNIKPNFKNEMQPPAQGMSEAAPKAGPSAHAQNFRSFGHCALHHPVQWFDCFGFSLLREIDKNREQTRRKVWRNKDRKD